MTDRHTAEQRARGRWTIAGSRTIGLPVRLSEDTRPEMIRNRNGSPVAEACVLSVAEAIVRALNEHDALVDEVERVTRENEAAHRALDDFDVPRDEPHFRSPYMLSGRIRWLRSHLVVDANQRAGRLIDEAQAAEAELAAVREQNQQLRDALDLVDAPYPLEVFPERTDEQRDEIFAAMRAVDPFATEWFYAHVARDRGRVARAALGDGEQQ